MHKSTAVVVPLFVSIGIVVLCSRSLVAEASTGYFCPGNLNATATAVTGSSCYAYFSTTLTWSAAKAACESIDGTLARIASSTENTAVHSIISSTEPWIGAADDTSLVSGSSEGEFFWHGDSQAFWTGGQGGTTTGRSYANWNTGTSEPNNGAGTEDCVQMYANGQWNDYDCSDPKSYVCLLTASENETTSSVETGGGGGGVRAQTLQNKISASLQRTTTRHASANDVGGEPTNPAILTSSQQRICDRVLRIFGDNPKMLEKINARLTKSMNFSCRT